MSEVNEKMISEFLDLLKKVNSLEMQVQSIARDHDEVMMKTTKMIQTMQDGLNTALQKQNKLVSDTNDNIINQVNIGLSKVQQVATSHIESYLKNHESKENWNYLKEQQNEMQKKINKTFKNLSLITKAFRDAEISEEKENIEKDDRLSIPIEEAAFTMRTINCLRAENIKTINDLIKWKASELVQTPNLGKKSLCEIQEVLKNMGLELRAN